MPLLYGTFRLGILVGIFSLAIGQVGFCLSDDNTGKCDERDEVRDGHETVYDISQDPDGLELQEGAGGYKDDEDQAIGQDALDAEQVQAGAFAVVVPAQDGRERKEHESQCQELAADIAEGAGKGS